jgi:hypothetical protein
MTNDARDYSRKELLELSASRYLGKGFVDSRGKALPELQTTFATAAATQFGESQLSPQELAFTFEALKQALPLYTDTPSARTKSAIAEALEVVRGMIKQPNNARLVQWLSECSAAVKSEVDIVALVEHFMAVLRQYTVIVASASR